MRPGTVDARVGAADAVAGSGGRPVTVCGSGSRERGVRRDLAYYQRRPFVAEELCSAQIARAVRLLDPMDKEQLYERVIELTGPDEEQLTRAALRREDHHACGPDQPRAGPAGA
ncbi:hypothetical protein [Kitasatospora sp. NPDC094015]|uniref:hypothetical protein n=1 Tax=Kitasatospora sp. NPDC094015 TaxID=3155205 RepID=UPI003319DB79